MEGLSRLDELCQEVGRQAPGKTKDKVPAKESGANGGAPSLDDFLKMFEEEDSKCRLPRAADLIVARSDEEAKVAADATAPAALLEDEDGDVAHVFLEEAVKAWDEALSEVPREKLKSHEVVKERKRGGFSVSMDRPREHGAPAVPAPAPVRTDAKAEGAATAEGIFKNFGSNRAEALRVQKQEAVDRQKAQADFFARFSSEGDGLSDQREEDEDLQRRLARLKARQAEEDKDLEECKAEHLDESVEERKQEEARLRAEMMKSRAQRLAAKRKERQQVERQGERLEDETRHAEEERLEAQRRREQEERLEAERRKAEEERLELERKQEQEKLEEERRRAEERLEAQRRREEEERLEAERRKAEGERLEFERKQEQEKLEEERRRAEERLEAQRRREEEERLEAERRKAEEERLELERKQEQEKLDEVMDKEALQEKTTQAAPRRRRGGFSSVASKTEPELGAPTSTPALAAMPRPEQVKKQDFSGIPAEELLPTPARQAARLQSEKSEESPDIPSMEALLAMLGEDPPEDAAREEPQPSTINEPEPSQPIQEKPTSRRRRGGFTSAIGAGPAAAQAQTGSSTLRESEQEVPAADEVPSMEALLAMLDEDREG